MTEEPYVGSEALSFLKDAIALVEKEIDSRHGRVDAFISTYGFQPVGVWWLERMKGVLNQIAVTALFGIVEGATREHLRNASVTLDWRCGWGGVRNKFRKQFNHDIGLLEGYRDTNRARLLANYFKHTGSKSWHELISEWPICGQIFHDPESGVALHLWAQVPVEELFSGVDKLLENLQDVAGRAADTRGS